MSGVLKTVGKIAGVVAAVTRFIPGLQGVSAIASAVAVVSATAGALTAKKPPERGSTSNILIGRDMPIPYTVGRTYIGGNMINDAGYGGRVSKVDNPYRALTSVFSGAGPIDGFESFQADFAGIGTGGAVGGYYSGFLWIDTQLGASPESSALTAQFAGEPGWSSAHKLSGFAAAKFTAKFDKDGEVFASGIPQLGAIVRGVKAYDPRADSTFPGGSGSQRLNNESTWAYTTSPALHAATYGYGRVQNGVVVLGGDLGAEGVDWATVAAWANVCTANGWEVGGTVYEPPGSGSDVKWSNLKRIAAAGGAEPFFSGGVLSFRYEAPRVSLDTVTIDDIDDGEIIIPGVAGWRERKNAIVPKYRSEAHQWEVVSTDRVQVGAFVTADGEEKDEEIEWDMVQDADHVSQLAAYELYNRREIRGITLPLRPRFAEYKVDDALTLNLPDDGLVNQLAVVTGRTPNPETGGFIFEFATETAGKHDFALGRTGTPPPVPVIATAQERDEIAFNANSLIVEQTMLPVTDALALTAAGKSTIFYRTTAPTHLESVENDRWVDLANGNKEYRRVPGTGRLCDHAGNLIVSATGDYLVGCWTPADDSRISAAITAAAGAQALADGKVTTFNQEQEPTNGDLGDLWRQPSTNIVRRWDEASWADHSSLGAPAGTLVAGRASEDVTAASVNFDARNDRLATAVAAPTIAGDGSAIDHSLNANGSADLSFEWIWGGAEADIDGFEIMVRGSTASGSFTPDVSASGETVYIAQPNKRAFILYGVQPTLYWTFAVRAFRVVDPDVSASGFLRSAWVQPGASGENPYRPETNTAFAGDVSGTVNGVAAAIVSNYTRNVDRGAWSAASVDYVVGDEVQDQSSTWGALTAHTSSGGNGPPTLPTTANATWRLRSKVGDVGAEGPSGFTVSPPSQAITIGCTSNGTPKSGELLRTVTFVVLQDGVDLAEDAGTGFSVSATNCTATMGGTNDKLLTITAIAADSASAVVTVTVDAVTIATVPVLLTKARDGAAGVSASDTSLTINNTSSYTGTQGGPITLAVGPTGTVNVDINMPYTVASGGAAMAGKVQYRTTPGSGGWTDMPGGEVQDSVGALPGEAGLLSFSDSIAGPGSAASWEFQFVNRRYSGGVTVTVDSASDVMTVSWSG